MAARIIDARETATQTVLRVHLDEERVDGLGAPDPAFVAEFRWARHNPAGGEGSTEYIARVRQEAREKVRAKLDEVNAVTALIGTVL